MLSPPRHRSMAMRGEAPTFAPLCRTVRQEKKSAPEVKRALEITALCCLLAGTTAAAIFCVLLYDADRLVVDSNLAVLSVAVGAPPPTGPAHAPRAATPGIAHSARPTLTAAATTR